VTLREGGGVGRKKERTGRKGLSALGKISKKLLKHVTYRILFNLGGRATPFKGGATEILLIGEREPIWRGKVGDDAADRCGVLFYVKSKHSR